MDIYKSQEKYNQAERDYLNAKQEFDKTKNQFDFMRAKHYTFIKTRGVAEGTKPTVKDIDAELLNLQSDANHELGKAFIEFSTALAKKQMLYVEMNIAKREYYSDMKLM